MFDVILKLFSDMESYAGVVKKTRKVKVETMKPEETDEERRCTYLH